jgi:C4-dicarboxylate-specific signal transduction histidine kinase
LSGAGANPQASVGASAQPAPQFVGATPKGRSPLAHLLHALNQPLTGLQCSLELAVAGPRPIEQYVRALREGLELTGRMRILVEAIREVADAQPSEWEDLKPLLLDQLLRSTAADLLPVAEARGVRLVLEKLGALPLRADRRALEALLFRFLESALSLTREGSDLRIAATVELGHAILVVSWNQGSPPEHSPFSRPEVGLLARDGSGQARNGSIPGRNPSRLAPFACP